MIFALETMYKLRKLVNGCFMDKFMMPATHSLPQLKELEKKKQSLQLQMVIFGKMALESLDILFIDDCERLGL